MKRGFYEKPGLRYGWAAVNGGGYLLGDIRSTKKELIKHVFGDWNIPWKTIKRKYGIRIVWVRIEVLEK